MTSLKSIALLLWSIALVNLCSAQQPEELLTQAQQYLNRSDYTMAAELLAKALNKIQKVLLNDLESAFPNPPKHWRADDVNGRIVSLGRKSGLIANRSYFQQGGGASVDIKMETNANRIGNVKALLRSPAKLQRVDTQLKIRSCGERRCLEKYDKVDHYGEIILVPTSSCIVTLKGQSMKDTKLLHDLADAINWTLLESRFP